jgi:hypothetical protein
MFLLLGRNLIHDYGLYPTLLVGLADKVRIRQLYGKKGVLRCTLAFKGTERKGGKSLVPPNCPSEIFHFSKNPRNHPRNHFDCFRAATTRPESSDPLSTVTSDIRVAKISG